jgi:glutamine---fructose-6-phosphate transaminase (isomerizing)
MCGIIGYTGYQQAQLILLTTLKRLEYRGYDSSGIAVQGSNLQIFKDKVRIDNLQIRTPLFHETSGIGHTRWATHGELSQANAHPH